MSWLTCALAHTLTVILTNLEVGKCNKNKGKQTPLNRRTLLSVIRLFVRSFVRSFGSMRLGCDIEVLLMYKLYDHSHGKINFYATRAHTHAYNATEHTQYVFIYYGLFHQYKSIDADDARINRRCDNEVISDHYLIGRCVKNGFQFLWKLVSRFDTKEERKKSKNTFDSNGDALLQFG